MFRVPGLRAMLIKCLCFDKSKINLTFLILIDVKLLATCSGSIELSSESTYYESEK